MGGKCWQHSVKILNFGSISTDFVYEVPHILVGGETCSSLSRSIYPGGKGLNSTVALARAGAPVYFAGTVGEDGEWLVDVVREAGADASLVDRTEGPSGHTVIQVDPDAENCIIVFSGANRKNSKKHIDRVLSQFEAGDYIVLQNEINDLPYIINSAYARGLQIVLNPSPCDDIINTLPLGKVSYLVVNRAEAAVLAKLPENAPDRDILRSLHVMYPEARLVMTIGGDGALYSDGELVIHQDPLPADAVDTTGAGDTFLGNFVTGIAEGMAPAEALRLAAAAAAIAVSRKGAATSIPTREETQRLLIESS